MFYAPLITWLLSERCLTAAQLHFFCLTLCAWPRSEEKCLVRSGLVQLMDRLCSLSSQTESSSSEKQTKKQKVATMAWAAFQVLANRCVEWEKEEGRKQGSFLELIDFFRGCLFIKYPCRIGERKAILNHIMSLAWSVMISREPLHQHSSMKMYHYTVTLNNILTWRTLC